MHAPVQPPDPIPNDLLLQAYRAGIFPMADHRTDPEIFWVEPRTRAIIPLGSFHMSRSLRKIVRQDRYSVTCDRDFGAVIEACAEPREEHAESWISETIEASYIALNQAGSAHSFECWRDGELVGGLYGVAFDSVFCGESMFSRADNASKVALVWLVACLKQAGFKLLDCQFMTDHLASMGAVTMPQADYLDLLAKARMEPRCGLPEAWRSYAESSSSGKDIAQSLTQTS